MAGKVLLVTYQFSVVVKSMEKGLADQNFEVTVMEDDVNTISLMIPEYDVLLLYLRDTVLSSSSKLKDLFLLCDNLKDFGKRMILIGADLDREPFRKAVPALKDYQWMSRPVDMNDLVKEIELEIRRQAARSEKKKLLIIDDDAGYARMIAEFLKDSYHVDMVTDGMKGIAYLANNEVDLILLDYEMPVVDGPKILEMLKMHPDTKNIPVIFLTGVGTKESIQRVMSLRPQGYVLKTTTRGDLLKTLNDFFEKKRLSEGL